MTRPLVSVVIPAYQAEKTLGAAITSALMQSYRPVEVIVCVDGATDASEAIARAYGDLVTVIRQENQGLSAARNTAIRHASGEFIAVLDSDDELLPPYLERAVARLERSGEPRSFVSTNALFLARHGIVGRIFQKPREDLSKQRMLMIETNIATVFSVFPKKMWTELDGFSVELTAMEDYDFWARAVLSGWKLLFVSEPNALYRLTPGSMSSKGELMNANNARVRRRLLDQFGDSMSASERELMELTLRHDWAGYNLDLAAVALAQGDVAEAARLCLEASVVTPSDHRLRLKAELLRRVPHAGWLYRQRQDRRLERVARS